MTDQDKRLEELARPVLWAQRRGEDVDLELRRALLSAMAYGVLDHGCPKCKSYLPGEDVTRCAMCGWTR